MIEQQELAVNSAKYVQVEVKDGKFEINSNYVEEWLKNKDYVIAIDSITGDKMFLTPFELAVDAVSDNVFKKSYNGGRFTKLSIKWQTDSIKQTSISAWSEALLRRFHYSFFNLLKDYLVSEEFININRKYNIEERKKGYVYPEKENVYRVFSNRADTTRVVFVSLDPYNTTHANGYAFATDQISKPISLRQIEKSIIKDLNYPEDWEIQKNLEHMVKQGVLFLNSSLTISAGATSGQNIEGWRPFITKVLQVLNSFEPLIFVFIGKAAQSHSKTIDQTKHFVYELEHPAYAQRQDRDWNSRGIFEEINNKLKKLGTPELKW